MKSRSLDRYRYKILLLYYTIHNLDKDDRGLRITKVSPYTLTASGPSKAHWKFYLIMSQGYAYRRFVVVGSGSVDDCVDDPRGESLAIRIGSI